MAEHAARIAAPQRIGILEDVARCGVDRAQASPRTSVEPWRRISSRSSALVASAYTRTSGSVPLKRTSSQEPSSSQNLKPSLVLSVSVRTTFWPPIEDGRLLAQLDQQAVLQRRIGRLVDMNVGAQVERLAGDLVQMLNGLRDGPVAALALANEEVEQQQVGVDAVALGQVHAEAVAARLLAAHHRAGLDHLRSDVLEADRRLVHLDAVALAEAADHRGLVDRRYDRLAQAVVLEQVVHEQAHHLQLMDERALLVGRARAVRVAVEKQAQVVAAAGEDAQRLVDVRREWAPG